MRLPTTVTTTPSTKMPVGLSHHLLSCDSFAVASVRAPIHNLNSNADSISLGEYKANMLLSCDGKEPMICSEGRKAEDAPKTEN